MHVTHTLEKTKTEDLKELGATLWASPKKLSSTLPKCRNDENKSATSSSSKKTKYSMVKALLPVPSSPPYLLEEDFVGVDPETHSDDREEIKNKRGRVEDGGSVDVKGKKKCVPV